jgi:methylation protein EvaC
MDSVPPNVLFGPGYAYFSSISTTMKAHFAALADILCQEFLSGSYARSLYVEIGCNDGILLSEVAQRYGGAAVGVEPSDNVAQAARDRGLDVRPQFFDVETASALRAEHGSAEVIAGANVICHIPDWTGLMKGVDELLSPTGVFVFEDPSLLEIVTTTAYDQFYDEHIFYFSALSLQNALGRFGFEIFRIQPLQTHGGSNRIFAKRKMDTTRPVEPSVLEHLKRERDDGLDHIETYHVLSEHIVASRAALRELLLGLKRQGKQIAGYGATSKGTIVLNYCNIGPDILDYISDTTPFKQGLYSPGKHIPIVPHEHFKSHPPDYALLSAWNHGAEILEKESAYVAAGGRFIVHLPTARVL